MSEVFLAVGLSTCGSQRSTATDDLYITYFIYALFFWTGKGCPTPPLLEPASLLFLQKHLLKKIKLSYFLDYENKYYHSRKKKKKQKVFNNLYMQWRRRGLPGPAPTRKYFSQFFFFFVNIYNFSKNN